MEGVRATAICFLRAALCCLLLTNGNNHADAAVKFLGGDVRADLQGRLIVGSRFPSVLIYGRIEKGDAAEFRAITRRSGVPSGVSRIFVQLDSVGGNVDEALAIGREIRRRFMFTSVLRDAECDSACVFILAAGVDRSAAGKIGLHRPSFDATAFAGLDPTAARDRYNHMVDQLREYYVGEMGGSPDAFRIHTEHIFGIGSLPDQRREGFVRDERKRPRVRRMGNSSMRGDTRAGEMPSDHGLCRGRGAELEVMFRRGASKVSLGAPQFDFSPG